MGKKGDRRTGAADEAANDFVARAAAVSGIRQKKMFGGVGIFSDGVMFGIIDSKGKAFLRCGPENEAAFAEAGSEKHGRMPYYSIPSDVLADDHALTEWAQLSAKVARAAKK